jgi:hypothetical protein
VIGVRKDEAFDEGWEVAVPTKNMPGRNTSTTRTVATMVNGLEHGVGLHMFIIDP